MNWLNLELTTLRSEKYIGSDPVQRATWLNLLAYCADQENGGTIQSCSEWGSRKWLGLLGVTKEEVLSDSLLWNWSGENVVVWKYPKAKESEVRQKRISGKRGGRPAKPNKDGGEKPDGLAERNHVVPLCLNGKEGNRKGIGKEPPKPPVKKEGGEVSKKYPEYQQIKDCPQLSKINRERYIQIRSGFPKSDASKVVFLACLKSGDPDNPIGRPDRFLISCFTRSPDVLKSDLPYEFGGKIIRKNTDGSQNEADLAAFQREVV